MNSTDHDLKDLIDRHLKWPSDLSFTAARDRVREQLLATPARLQTARVADAPPSIPMWRMAAAAAVVVAVAIGTAIVWPRARVYAAGNDGLQVTLADDSRVEMRAHSEMTVGRAADGIQIDLKTGDIIVTAAKQRDGHLYVRTKDMTVSVVGTVFLVNADQEGSRVGVIEGEVRVREGGRETRLRPGEQVATSSAIVARPLTEDINWSRNATAHLAILDSSMKATAQPAQSTAPITPPEQAATVANSVANSQAAKTEFEEASIRECDSGTPPPGVRGAGPGRFQMTPGRTNADCLTLATIIRTAYGGGLQDGPLKPPPGRPIVVVARGVGPDPRSFAGASAMSFGTYFLGVEDGARVRGGPDWVRSALYTIEAVAAGAADAQTMRGPMLRALLERRFGLKVHVGTEQFPVPQLTVAPGGRTIRRHVLAAVRRTVWNVMEAVARLSGRAVGAAKRDSCILPRCPVRGRRPDKRREHRTALPIAQRLRSRAMVRSESAEAGARTPHGVRTSHVCSVRNELINRRPGYSGRPQELLIGLLFMLTLCLELAACFARAWHSNGTACRAGG